MIAATVVSTSAPVSRFASSSWRKAGSNSASCVESLTGIGCLPWRCVANLARLAARDRPAETIYPAADFLRAGLQRWTVDDQARAYVGNALDLDQAVRSQRGAGLDKVDNVATKTEVRSELDRTVELDAFRLDAARGEMAAGDLRVFRSHPDMARPRDIFARSAIGGHRHREMAVPEGEVEGCVNLGIVEFHQHIVAGDAELG